MNENSPKFSIQDMLAEKSVSGLTSIAKSLGLKGYSGKKKAAIINLIVPKVTSKEFLEDLLLVVDRRAWSAILSARSAPTHVPDSASGPCKSLARLGILRWTRKRTGYGWVCQRRSRTSSSNLRRTDFWSGSGKRIFSTNMPWRRPTCTDSFGKRISWRYSTNRTMSLRTLTKCFPY